MSGALDSLTVTAADLAPALAFYDAALGALGLGRVVELVDEEEDEPDVEAVGYGASDSDSDTDAAALWVVTGAPSTTGLHVRFRAGSRSQVEAFYGAALASGGRPHAAPRRWAIYRRGDFNAIVRDPLGNLVEAVAGE